jgi:tetratricopeptide repeat protein
VGAPAEIPHADEDLKSLVARFKQSPGSSAFTELAAALLVRGHAAEALRIAEHGLQLIPESVDGRIERAAALLALGRPRVAYVELKRALAINPTNRRAMRLLGKVYVDVGAPSRAAELLAQRFKNGEGSEDETEATHVTQAPFPAEHRVSVPASNALSTRADTEPLRKKEGSIPAISGQERRIEERRADERRADDRREARGAPDNVRTHPDGPSPLAAQEAQLRREAAAPEKGSAATSGQRKKETALPDLFSDLTRDLGLGTPAPETPQKRVEVTQVIRRRGVRARSPSELAQIEGPIVDTTQPGQIHEISSDIGVPQGPGEPPPLFDAVTSPRLQIAPFGLDDEPLFQEQMPFSVKPVEGEREGGGGEDPLGDLRETLDEEAPPGLDSALMREALDGQSGGPGSIGAITQPPKPAPGAPPRFTEGGDTFVDQLEDAPERLPTSLTGAQPPSLHGRDRSSESADQARFESGMPLLELSRPSRRAAASVRLELATPKAKPLHIVLAIAGGLVMAIYLVILLLIAPDPWAPDLPRLSSGASEGHAAPAVDRSSEARTSR